MGMNLCRTGGDGDDFLSACISVFCRLLELCLAFVLLLCTVGAILLIDVC